MEVITVVDVLAHETIADFLDVEGRPVCFIRYHQNHDHCILVSNSKCQMMTKRIMTVLDDMTRRLKPDQCGSYVIIKIMIIWF